MPVKKVTVPVPDYLHQWLADTADRDYRTVQQQIVFLLARAFEGFTPEVNPSVAAVARPAQPTEPAANQPAVGGASSVLVPDARYPVLDKPPDGKVTTIKVHGISKEMGATYSTDGNGPLYRIETDLWAPVEPKYKQMNGKTLHPLGQYGNTLYLSA